MKSIFLALVVLVVGFEISARSILPVNPPNLEIQIGVFDMYSKRNHSVVPSCDHGVKLTLDNGSVLGPVAVVENFLRGTCEIVFTPYQSLYKLTFSHFSCGSRVYVGERPSGFSLSKVLIIDHRGRTCRDIQQNKIEMIETKDGFEDKSYSLPDFYFIPHSLSI